MPLTRIVNGVAVVLSADDEAAQLAEWSANAALPLPPDVPGFLDALKSAMGGIVASNTLAKAYPLFHAALDKAVWVDVQALIIDAHTTRVLSDVQYAAFKQLAAAHHLPIVLP